MKNVLNDWLCHSEMNHNLIFTRSVDKLMQTCKVPNYVYNIMFEASSPVNHLSYWNDLFNVNVNSPTWEEIFSRNFKCTIHTRLRSFFFKLFYRAIALNDFLFKIKRKDSPLCSFCNNSPETFLHLFISCPQIQSLWQKTVDSINQKDKKNVIFSNLERMFGFHKDIYITHIFLSLKYYIYICKFQNKTPAFDLFKAYLKNNKETEYIISKKKGKLAAHFRKWRFEL